MPLTFLTVDLPPTAAEGASDGQQELEDYLFLKAQCAGIRAGRRSARQAALDMLATPTPSAPIRPPPRSTSLKQRLAALLSVSAPGGPYKRKRTLDAGPVAKRPRRAASPPLDARRGLLFGVARGPVPGTDVFGPDRTRPVRALQPPRRVRGKAAAPSRPRGGGAVASVCSPAAGGTTPLAQSLMALALAPAPPFVANTRPPSLVLLRQPPSPASSVSSVPHSALRLPALSFDALDLASPWPAQPGPSSQFLSSSTLAVGAAPTSSVIGLAPASQRTRSSIPFPQRSPSKSPCPPPRPFNPTPSAARSSFSTSLGDHSCSSTSSPAACTPCSTRAHDWFDEPIGLANHHEHPFSPTRAVSLAAIDALVPSHALPEPLAPDLPFDPAELDDAQSTLGHAWDKPKARWRALTRSFSERLGWRDA